MNHIIQDSIDKSRAAAELRKLWGLHQVESNSVLELRAIWGKGVPNSKAPRFQHFRASDFSTIDDLKRAFEIAALRWSDDGYNVYTPINPIRPDFGGPGGAKDSDIVCRRLLLVDIDRSKDSSRPASQQELDAARSLAFRVADFTAQFDVRPPYWLMSGNGYHLYYLLDDIPNVDESTALVKTTLNALAEEFDNDVVAIDTRVYNAARITKVPGTVARKGLETPDRPYRMAVTCNAP